MITEAYKTFTTADYNADNKVELTWSVPTAGTWLAAMIHFDSGHTANSIIQVIFRSSHGDDYDTVLLEEATTAKTDYYLAPDIEVPISRGDTIAIVYKDANKPKVAVTIKGNDSVR